MTKRFILFGYVLLCSSLLHATHLGSRGIDDPLTFEVQTFDATTGAPADADAVPTYRIYEDETTTPILTRSMALHDASNTDGWYSEQITLSVANGFENGKSYTVRIFAAVGGQSGVIERTFTVGAQTRVAVGGILASSFNAGAIDASAIAANAIGNSEIATGALTLDRFSGVFPPNFLALGINASGHVSRVTLADTITTYTGNTVQTGDSFARIGANGAGLTSLSTQTSVNACRLRRY